MSSGARHDLSHIYFENQAPPRRQRDRAQGARHKVPATAAHAPEEPLDDFLAWVFERAGLQAAAYRPQSLHRRLPACLRALQVRSPRAARDLLERKPALLAKALNALLIGVTAFYREPDVFDALQTKILPELARRNPRLRVWSAACSSGAELYSMAILLSEAGLLEQSYLLGADCRADAIERAKQGLYDAATLKLVSSATRDKFFEPAGQHWRPIKALRRHVHWKVADLLTGVEHGPWDMILWRNAAIYLKSWPADVIWRQLTSVLAPGGVLIAGKAERPPADAGLANAARCIYRRANRPATGPVAAQPQSPLPQSPGKNTPLEPFR